MKTDKTYRVAALLALLILAFTAAGQNKADQVCDPVTFVQSDVNGKLIYLKWRSEGKNPARSFTAFRFEQAKPVAVNGPKQIYHVKDTTWFVFQDTAAPAIPAGGNLQYFMLPSDTAGKAGYASAVVLLTGDDYKQAHFTKTSARQADKLFAIILSWRFTDPVHTRSIGVYRSTDPLKDFVLLSSVGGGDTTFTDIQIIPDKVYYYKLLAQSENGAKVRQSNVFFSAGFNPQKPVPPMIRSAIGIRGGVKLTIQVTDPEAAGFRVYRNDGDQEILSPVSDLVNLTDTTLAVYVDSGANLSGRKAYTYAVRTESTSFVLSDLSASINVRPLLQFPPENPVSFQVYEENGLVKLFWQMPDPSDDIIAGYILMRKAFPSGGAKDGSWVTLAGADVPLAVNGWTDTTALPGITYEYSVQSVDIDGNVSTGKTIGTVSLQPDRPIPPSGLQVFSTPEGIVLEWSEVILKEILFFKIYRYQPGGEPEQLKIVGKTTTTYTDPTAVAGKQYFYYLTTIDKQEQESAPSQEAGIYR
jgi:fibronectin type 3 domain-containing protein